MTLIDIIVFKSPEESGLTLVKRLIALPRDHVAIENGKIMINGERIEIDGDPDNMTYFEVWGEKKVQIKRSAHFRLNSDQEFIVPANMFFFMGDNRDNSHDSRAWGFVPRENLKGRAHFVLWNVEVKNWRLHTQLKRIGEKL